MAYTSRQAVAAFNEYTSEFDLQKSIIDDTKDRGFLIEMQNEDSFVAFLYPLVHKQDNTKNYFDTRDSGAYERGVAWKYALSRHVRYFCFGINDQVEKYKDYVFSLECDEAVIETISGTKDGVRNGPGNQIIIPNDYVPSKPFERIKNRLGIYIAVIHKSVLLDYIEKYDNRPYMSFTDEEHRVYGIHMKSRNDALDDANPHISIGWSVLGDLSDISSKDELKDRYAHLIEKDPRGMGQDVGQIWRFINEAQVGDYVFYSQGSICHIGQIESNYFFDNTERETQDNDYKNCRLVVWLKKDIEKSVLSDALQKCLGTGMSFWTMNDYKSAVIDLLNGTYVKDEIIENEDMEDIMPLKYNTGILPELSRNRILFGAPGTGKSYRLESDRKELLNNDEVGGYERVTFHPDYTYSQFVGTYKPVTDPEGNIRYEFVPGPFMRVYVDALKSGMSDNPQPYILVIEEINRANVAAVFGDIFQLLDRDAENVSEYQIQASEDVKKYLADRLGGDISNYGEIKIPDNMFIWATMNSADQGVFPMDTAFKRRWDFTYLGINNNEDIISGKYVCIGQGAHERKVEWNELRKAINEVLLTECRVNEDKLMGPFFISMKNLPNDDEDSEKFIKVFKNKVLMYLFDDAGKQKRATLFDGCSKKNLYSAICEEFEEKGIDIFGNAVRSHFPMKDQLDSED